MHFMELRNITQRRRSLDYNNRMLGVQSEIESFYVVFQATHCYILRAHGTRVARRAILCWDNVMGKVPIHMRSP